MIENVVIERVFDLRQIETQRWSPKLPVAFNRKSNTHPVATLEVGGRQRAQH